MKKLLLPFAVMLAASGSALSQQAPFDMSPETGSQNGSAPAAAPQQPPSQPQAAPAPAPAPAASSPVSTQPPASAYRRHIVPGNSLTLAGEIARRSWAVHLTAAQAASAATLHVGYQNAIVVAPENSFLEVSLNGTVVVQEPIRSANDVRPLSIALPAGVLHAGRNEISFRTIQRHRTDCTVESTYELWTRIDSADTFLTFADATAANFDGLEDLRAFGGDANGTAHIHIEAPALARNDVSAELLSLAQAIALFANVPNMTFSIGAGPAAADRNADLTVLVGTVTELNQRVDLRNAQAGSPFAAFVQGQAMPTLAISGETSSDWLSVVNQLVAQVDRPPGAPRDFLVTESWRTPNAPMFYTGRSLTLAELGQQSEQFAGRRYQTTFQFAVPADFYADSYGQARLFLDAAYSDAVRPGSLINIYVNDNIAASMPITTRRGAILRQLPIDVTMRHFRPGLNTIAIEVNLRTEEDAVCAPGTTADANARFALFDTSRLQLPTFARVAQRPNLSATGGTAFPYHHDVEPVSLVMNRADAASQSAAATLMGRLAKASGRVIPVSIKNATDTAGPGDAIFLGAVNDLPENVFLQTGVAPEVRTSWTGADISNVSPQISVQQWRQNIEGSRLSRTLTTIERWFSDTFNITLGMLRFVPQRDEAFVPSNDVMTMFSQGRNIADTGVWTVVTAPDSKMLESGVAAFTTYSNWSQISGRLSTLDRDMQTVSSIPVSSFEFIQTQPASIANYRLILANWLSANILSYSAMLVIVCGALGFATTLLLNGLGRKK